MIEELEELKNKLYKSNSLINNIHDFGYYFDIAIGLYNPTNTEEIYSYTLKINYYIYGLIYHFKLKQYKLAIKYLKKSLDTKFPFTYYRLGNSYHKDNDIYNAIKYYTEALPTIYQAGYELHKIYKFINPEKAEYYLNIAQQNDIASIGNIE
jgi:tetratricopeptide (TPR) repeat protein